MVCQMYPSELQLNKADTSDTEAAFLDLHLSISNDIVSTKFVIKVTNLIFKLSISQLLTQKLLKQGYRYHKLCKTFSKFYRRYFDLISKFQVGLKSLLCQGLSEPEFYGDLVSKLKKIVVSNNNYFQRSSLK